VLYALQAKKCPHPPGAIDAAVSQLAGEKDGDTVDAAVLVTAQLPSG